MPLIAWADIVGLAPELSTLTATQQTLIVDQLDSEFVTTNWPSEARAKIAATWLGAHLGAVLKRGGGNAPVQSISVGGVSKTYATSVSEDASILRSTSYGQEYLRQLRIYGVRHAVT